MAKNTLPVDFQDDIMNSSMGGNRRYKMINNSDGTVSFEDATTYDQVGSNFGAGQMNATNTAVNEAADKNKVIQDLDAIRNVTEDGYIAGAIALKQVEQSLEELGEIIMSISKGKILLVGNSTSFNISNVVGAENVGQYSEDDFVCVPNLTTLTATCGSGNAFSSSNVTISTSSISLTYDNTTGDVSVTNMTLAFSYKHGAQYQSANWEIPTNVYLCVRTF